MPSLFASSGQTPTMDDVQAKKQLAQLMMSQLGQPNQGAVASGSPLLAAIAPFMQALAAKKAQSGAQEAEQGLLGQRQQELARIMAAGQGTPAQPGQPFIDEQAQFMGQPSPEGLKATPDIPGKPGGREALIRAMTESTMPEFQNIGLGAMLNPGKQAEGFTLTPGQARFDASGRPIAMLPKDKNSRTLENLSVGEKAVDKEFAKEYVDFKASGGFADVEKNLKQLEIIAESLKTESLTGPVTGRTPDFIKEYTNPAAIAARDTVEEVVQRNLRLILGAQFTQKEGERLIARSFNPNLSEKENKKRVDRLVKQIKTAALAKQEASNYFEEHGTLSGFKGKLWSMSDFQNDIEPKKEQQPQGGPTIDDLLKKY